MAQLIQEVSRGTDFVVDVLAWLCLNSIRSDRLQNVQLCVQNVSAVWRRAAFAAIQALARQASAPGASDEVHTADSSVVNKWASLFVEPLDRDLWASVDEPAPLLAVTTSTATRTIREYDLNERDATAIRSGLQALLEALQPAASASTGASFTDFAMALQGNLDATQQRESAVTDWEVERGSQSYLASLLDARVERAAVDDEQDVDNAPQFAGIDSTMVQTQEHESESERQRENQTEQVCESSTKQAGLRGAGAAVMCI